MSMEKGIKHHEAIDKVTEILNRMNRDESYLEYPFYQVFPDGTVNIHWSAMEVQNIVMQLSHSLGGLIYYKAYCVYTDDIRLVAEARNAMRALLAQPDVQFPGEELS